MCDSTLAGGKNKLVYTFMYACYIHIDMYYKFESSSICLFS